MKVQFFNPPVWYYMHAWHRMNPALGMPILASVLEKAGHKAEITDLEAMRIHPDKLGEAYKNQENKWPDVVGITTTTSNLRGAKDTVAAIRGAGYNGYIMVGGPHATLAPDDFSDVDVNCVFRGEAETRIVEIVETQPDRCVIQGTPTPIADVPAPLWTKHMPRINKYGGNAPLLDSPEAITMWSRGCPHQCIFCGNPVYRQQRIRMRPKENIYAELEGLTQWGIKSLFVYDDEICGGGFKHTAWLQGVCEAITPLGYIWKCQGRCSEKFITPELMKAMYEAGCRAIMWGIESFSHKVLNYAKKGIDTADILCSLERAHAAGIKNWAFLMVGQYEETVEDVKLTEKYLTNLKRKGYIDFQQVTVCTPVQGTELYDKAKEEGWLVEQSEEAPQMSQVRGTPWMTAKEVGYWRDRLVGI